MRSPREHRNLLHQGLSRTHRKFRFGRRYYTYGVLDRTVPFTAHTVEDENVTLTKEEPGKLYQICWFAPSGR